ncbi:MAG: NUDIX domain-containing protein [Pseudomonadota bacterium]
MATTKERIVRRLMQSYWRTTRPATLGAQGIVIDPNDRILLVRHTYRPGWHFPGGGVERNETTLTALTRELEEEAGVLLTARPTLMGLYANFRAFPSDHIAVFIVRSWERPVVPAPNNEIAEQGFFANDALPEGTVEGARRRLREIFEAADHHDHW